MSHARHYTPRALNCQTCGEVYHRRLNRPGDCGPCQSKRQREWAVNSGAERAAYLVNQAVKRGDMPGARELKCADCGCAADRYDHRDYNKPLVVEPVCGSCNNRRGPAIHLVHEADCGLVGGELGFFRKTLKRHAESRRIATPRLRD